MTFDPKKFLATYGGAQAEFDPQAFLRQDQPTAPEISKLESTGRGFAQSATLGFADEIVGAIESAAGSIGLTDVDKTYEQARDESRTNFAAAAEANPGSTLLGGLAGGLATAAIPGTTMASAGKALAMLPGAAGKVLAGSKLAQAATMGAGLGAVQGVGSSTKEISDVGEVVEDAAIGGGLGALGGLAGEALMRGGARGYRAIKGKIRDTFKPIQQRMQAIGVTGADMERAGGFNKIAEGVEEMARLKIFDPDAQGFPTPTRMFELTDQAMDSAAAKLRSSLGGDLPVVSGDDILNKFIPSLEQELIEKGITADRQVGNDLIYKMLNDAAETDGDLLKLLELKRKFGAEVNWSSKNVVDPSIKVKLYQKANTELDKLIHENLAEVASEMGGSAADRLNEFNDLYGKLSKVWPTLKRAADEFSYKGDKGGVVKIKDQIMLGSLGSGVGSLVGVTGLGAAAGMGGALLGAAARSTPGHLARAKIGEMMGLSAAGAAQKATSESASMAAGYMPRSLAGARDWIKRNIGMIQQSPEMAAAARDVLNLPDAAAENRIRALLPLIGQFVAPSPYQSEFSGKITSPQDRVAARQVITAQGLPPSVAAYHASMLNKSGTLQMYHYAPQPAAPQGDYGDELLNFNQRLTEMGY